MLTEKETRRLKALVNRQVGIPSPIIFMTHLKFSRNTYSNLIIKDAKELYLLLIKDGYDLVGDIKNNSKTYYIIIRYWKDQIELDKPKYDFPSKPIQRKQDNKDTTVGGGGSNRNKIRYPKKCRKTAWKRFYKLFPLLDPNKSDEEKQKIKNKPHRWWQGQTEAEKILNNK